MVKRFCDICGQQIDELKCVYQDTDMNLRVIKIEYRNREYDICPKCRVKINTCIDKIMMEEKDGVHED